MSEFEMIDLEMINRIFINKNSKILIDVSDAISIRVLELIKSSNTTKELTNNFYKSISKIDGIIVNIKISCLYFLLYDDNSKISNVIINDDKIISFEILEESFNKISNDIISSKIPSFMN
jgi:hypothetical protein